MRTSIHSHPTLARLAVTVTGAALMATSLPVSPIALADEVETYEQQRAEADSRADAAAASRNEAAARAEQAESQRDAANSQANNTQKALEEANARLDALFQELEIAHAELSKAIYELEQTQDAISKLEEEIRQNEAKLAKEQDNLSKQVSSAYKGGPGEMLEIVLDATSFDDFVSRVLYANKISEQLEGTINHVKAIQAELIVQKKELKAKEAEQIDLVAVKEEKQAAAEAAEQAQEAFVSSLSDELKAALEAARKAEAQAAKARAEEAEFAAKEDQARAEAAENQRKANEERERQAREAAAAAAAARNGGYVAPYISSAASGDQRGTAVNAALSQVGLPYIWGVESPGVGFDCNGLTHWAWSQAGVNIPYPSGHYMYGQFQWLRESGHWVYGENDLQPGDLVFYSSDGGSSTYHVAMYIGGGQVVHAHSYRLGVTVTGIHEVNGFCGGGSPI